MLDKLTKLNLTLEKQYFKFGNFSNEGLRGWSLGLEPLCSFPLQKVISDLKTEIPTEKSANCCSGNYTPNTESRKHYWVPPCTQNRVNTQLLSNLIRALSGLKTSKGGGWTTTPATCSNAWLFSRWFFFFSRSCLEKMVDSYRRHFFLLWERLFLSRNAEAYTAIQAIQAPVLHLRGKDVNSTVHQGGFVGVCMCLYILKK